MKAGAATQIINNELGTQIQGASVSATVQSIRDDLEANALWLESGDCGVLFISVDIGGMELDYVQQILPEIAAAAGVSADQIMIGYSHTHSAPSVLGPTHPDKALDEAYLERLKDWICGIARDAVSSAEPVTLACGKGRAEIGYNRRVRYADGSGAMHGDPTRPDFTGLEGDTDPAHTAFFLRGADGTLKAILYNSTSHPVNYYGADFLSADFPGAARGFLRKVLGNIPVLFFNGALGDISIYDEEWKARSPETADQRVARCAHIIAGETLRLLQHADFKDALPMGHVRNRFDVSIRHLPAEQLEWAQGVMADHRAGKATVGGLDLPTAHMNVLFDERFGNKATETIDLHAGHIGSFAFASVPCEMFTHFAVQLKRRSPFEVTALFGITNGDMGYCPTIEGIMGGSWEGTVSLTSRWEEQAGYRIVDEFSRMLFGLHASGRASGSSA